MLSRVVELNWGVLPVGKFEVVGGVAVETGVSVWIVD